MFVEFCVVVGEAEEEVVAFEGVERALELVDRDILKMLKLIKIEINSGLRETLKKCAFF